MIEFISYILFDLGLSQMFGLNKYECEAILKAAECFPVVVSLLGLVYPDFQKWALQWIFA